MTGDKKKGKICCPWIPEWEEIVLTGSETNETLSKRKHLKRRRA